jgi:tape measure domain-containing protein
VAEYNVDVTLDPRGFKRGAQQVRRGMNDIETSADRVRKTIARAFAFVGVGVAVRQLVQLADTFTNLQNRLRTVVSGQAALAAQTQRLFEVAQRTRSSYQGTVELYARVGLAAKELGRNQEELTNFTESLNQAIILSGASGEEAQAGLIQLSQGLASGALRGDELRSVLEQLPAVADVIAKELGITRGQLRELGAEGKITADIVLDAFKNARGELADRFAKTVPTISQAFQVLRNSLVQVVGGFDQALGPSRLFARILIGLAQNMDVLVRATAALALTIGVSLAARALPAAITGFRALTAVIAANPIGAIAVALTAVVSLLVTFSDQIGLSADGVVTLRDYAVAAFQLIAQYVGPLVVAIRDQLSAALTRATDTLAGFGLTWGGVLEAAKKAINGIIGLYVGLFRVGQVIFGRVRQLILDALGSRIGQHIIDVFKGVFGFLLDRFKQFASFAIKVMGLVGVAVEDLWGRLNQGPREVKFKIGPEGGAEQIQSLGEEVRAAFVSGFQRDFVGDIIGAVTPAFEQLQKRAREVAVDRRAQGIAPEAPAGVPARSAPTAAQSEALKAQEALYKQIKAPIEEYNATLTAANALLAQGAINAAEYSAALNATTLGGALQQLQLDLMPEGDRELEMLDQTLQQRLAMIQQFHEAKLLTEQEAQAMSLAASQQYNQAVLNIELERQRTQLKAASSAFQSMAQAAKGYVGEQSQIYRALFAVSKGFAAAETTVAIAQGIANAAKLGWPANIPAIAAVISQTSGLLAQINGAQFSGGFQNGGSFRVGGSGGPDSQLVAMRATPNETVSVRTPGQERAAAGMAPAQEAPQISIVNVTDPGQLEDFMASPAGEKQILNTIRRNGTQVKQFVG